MKTLLPLCLFFSCATLPETGMPATGEFLDVRGENARFLVNETVKVGEVTHRDRYGRVIGSSDVVAEQQRVASRYEWHMLQGSQPVDEQDFYRIAGDLEASEAVARHRNTGLTLNRIGWVGVVVGALAAVGGLVAQYALASSHTPNMAGYGVMVGGGLTAGLSYLVAALGLGMVHPDRRVFDENRARITATQYNARLQSQQVAPLYAPSPAAPRSLGRAPNGI